MSQTPAQPQISGTMFLFEKPELLNKEAHGKFGINRATRPFDFAAKARGIPVTVSELGHAFPLFVDDNGLWEAEAYVPGYIRRYPFALASESGGDRLAVVIDAGHQHLVEGGEMALFQGGEPTEATQNIIEFCKQYETDKVLTDRVLKAIEPFNLLVAQTARYTPGGQTEQVPFAQYFAVDEQRLNALTDEQFLELRRLGALPLLYLQLMSMNNWRNLMQRRARRFNLNDETVTRPVQVS